MFVLDCKIKIGEYLFKRVHNVQVVKSVDLLSDTAVIKMPASAMFKSGVEEQERKQLEDVIKAGDPVSITLAYKGVFENEEFTGFVTSIKPKNHIVTIECEDVLYFIRKARINKNFKNTTLKEVLNFILSETNQKLPEGVPPIKLDKNSGEINFDALPLKDKNGAQALKKLQDEYGLSIFVNDAREVYAGLRMGTNVSDEVANYHLQKNVVSHDLEYMKEEDVEIYVKVIGVKKDNQREEVIIGEQEGEQRTLHFYNISDKDKLKERGEEELEKLKYEGYRGNLTGFFVPHVTRGMGVTVTDTRYPSRGGSNNANNEENLIRYFVPKVTTTFGQNGARRKVELGAVIRPKETIG